MNKARPKRVWPTCGCCELLMAPRAFRKYGPPTKQAIAEQIRELGDDEPLLDYETELELLVFGDRVDTYPWWWLGSWDDEQPPTIVGEDFELWP